MAASISLKLSRGDETRVLSLPVHPIPTWQALAASLAERFQLDDGPSAVTYLDHEGDQITVSSDVELKDMWHSFAGKSSVSVGVVAPFVEADRSAATEKLLESIRDAVAADPSVAFDIHGILAVPPHGPPHAGRHGHHGGPPGGPRGGRGGGRGGRGGWHGHGHGHGRDGPMHPGTGHFPFFPPPPPPPFGDFMHARGAPPPPPPFGRHHPHGPPPPPPFCGRRHPHWHREESDSSESSDSSSSDSSDSESTHRRHGVPRRHRHCSRGHGRETARRSRTLASPY